jgi:hypothetical protein
MFTKPLKELTDTEVLDLLDLVSEEVKRRNSLNACLSEDGYDDQAMKRATDFISNAIQFKG